MLRVFIVIAELKSNKVVVLKRAQWLGPSLSSSYFEMHLEGMATRTRVLCELQELSLFIRASPMALLRWKCSQPKFYHLADVEVVLHIKIHCDLVLQLKK